MNKISIKYCFISVVANHILLIVKIVNKKKTTSRTRSKIVIFNIAFFINTAIGITKSMVQSLLL